MYAHITKDDRIVISHCLTQGRSYADIGAYIGKHKSTVHREITRNKDSDGRYRPHAAHKKARQRRVHAKYRARIIEHDTVLSRTSANRLDSLVSPEVAAHETGLSCQTIYSWIYRSRPDLKQSLPQRGRKRRRYGSKREKRQGWTNNVRSIHIRPHSFPSWEGDTIKGCSRARVLTHVEQTSLYLRADIIPDGTADSVHAVLARHPLCGTITYDRGSEFALWRMIEQDTPCVIFFADSHHPWQRGKNENTNGRLRRVFPKRFDFATITQRDLDTVVWHMNHTPRKSLSWRTPCEMYGKCCSSG